MSGDIFCHCKFCNVLKYLILLFLIFNIFNDTVHNITQCCFIQKSALANEGQLARNQISLL